MAYYLYSDIARKKYDSLSENDGYAKFIILGTPRVGSTWLLSLLQSHPQVLTYGEIFDTKAFLNDLREELSYPLFSFETVEYFENLKYNDPKSLLENYIYRKYNSVLLKAVGFKLFYFQPGIVSSQKKILKYLAANEDIKIIHIKRKNMLKSLISYKVALSTNKWATSFPGDEPEISPFFLQYETCLGEFEKIAEQQSVFEETLRNNNIYTLFYEDLYESPEKHCLEIQEFLNLEQEKLYSGMKKQKSKILSRIILNFDELKERFSSTRWGHFFE